MTPPSQFGALLRRSKFASYDPAIQQVYVSHGGHAARGQYGVKRSLPRQTRAPNAVIQISKIDTPEYQTEWESAESQQKWLARFKETAPPLSVMQNRTWDEYARAVERTWAVDSEFDSSSPNILDSQRASPDEAVRGREVHPLPLEPFKAIRAIPRMSHKRFDRYVQQLREQRPEFHQWLEASRARQLAVQRSEQQADVAKLRKYDGDALPTPAAEPRRLSLYETAASVQREPAKQQTSPYRWANYQWYLSERAIRQNLSPDSTSVIPIPHNFAGLQYHHPSGLQNVLTSDPVPGRILNDLPESANASAPTSQTRGKAPPKMQYATYVADSLARLYADRVAPTRPTGSINDVPEKPLSTFEFLADDAHAPAEERAELLEAGSHWFRVSKAELSFTPSVVIEMGEDGQPFMHSSNNRPARVGDTKDSLSKLLHPVPGGAVLQEVVPWKLDSKERARVSSGVITSPLGSRDWVAQRDETPVVQPKVGLANYRRPVWMAGKGAGAGAAANAPAAGGSESRQSQNLLGSLKSMMGPGVKR